MKPTLLVSCTLCRLLHEPVRLEDMHPLCVNCVEQKKPPPRQRR